MDLPTGVLPNSKELFSLIDRSQSNPALPTLHPFTNVQSGVDDLYWSSTTYAFDPTGAWTIDMLLGGLIPLLKTDPDQAFVWPVRGGQTRPYILEVEKLGSGQGKVTALDLPASERFVPEITAPMRSLPLLLQQTSDRFSQGGAVMRVPALLRALVPSP